MDEDKGNPQISGQGTGMLSSSPPKTGQHMFLYIEATLHGNFTYRSNHRLICDPQESQGNLFNSPTRLPSGCSFIVDLIGQGL